MLTAEGPQAFEDGYIKMHDLLGDDEAKLRYLEELYNDPNKAHFKGVAPFTNGTLVDLCETLFNATKHWVNGSSRRKRTTLLMAVVRIVAGVYEMICRNFLNPVAQITRSVKTLNAQVASMFRTFATKLTARAVKDMFDSLDSAWCNYEMKSNMDKSITLLSHHGDEFNVLEDFSCSCDDVPCWQQQHTGLLCKHALNACVYRLKQEPVKDKSREIIKTAVKKCNKNWHRVTYLAASPPDEFTKPASLEYTATARRTLTSRNCRELDFIRRFREVLHFVSPKVIEEKLHELESYALSDDDAVESDDWSSTEDGDVTDFSEVESSSVHSTAESAVNVSNPPRRLAKRRRSTYLESDDDSDTMR